LQLILNSEINLEAQTITLKGWTTRSFFDINGYKKTTYPNRFDDIDYLQNIKGHCLALCLVNRHFVGCRLTLDDTGDVLRINLSKN
jgi:hypothetical protein